MLQYEPLSTNLKIHIQQTKKENLHQALKNHIKNIYQ